MAIDRVLRAAGVALLVASAAAGGWAGLARATATGAPWAIVAGAVVIGAATRFAAGGRGLRVQVAAGAAFLVFLALGEGLLYRTALRPRLVAMHAAELETDPEETADAELAATGVWEYLQIEIGLAWIVAAGGGLWLALRIVRPPPAVVVFRAPTPADAVADAANGQSSHGHAQPTPS